MKPFADIIPGRLDVAQTAALLGFNESDIPVLVNAGLLQPIGKPPTQNCKKYFARTQILPLADDVAWLSKATKVLYQYWAGKNARRTQKDSAELLAA